jgi:hypothetical protein
MENSLVGRTYLACAAAAMISCTNPALKPSVSGSGGNLGVGTAGTGLVSTGGGGQASSSKSGGGGMASGGTSAAAGNAGTGGATGGGGGGTAGMGTGGTPTGGTTGASGTTGTAGSGDPSVLERGKDPSRDGNYTQPTLTTVAAATMMPDTTFNTNAAFTHATDAIYSSPLYLANSHDGTGLFIAATTNNDVKAFDDAGMPVWTFSAGANPISGGALSPKGIMSTPVIDATPGADGFGTIYACAPGAATAGGKMDRYELHAISAKDGTERTGWPAMLDGTVTATNDGLSRAFNPTSEGQRPALSLVNGIVYVGFGGPFGDFSTYFGWVIAVDTKSPATIGAWSTRNEGSGIWSPGGFASDGNGVIITTGNYFSGFFASPPAWGDNEAVIRLTGMPSALTRDDSYHPARFAFMDATDQDLGASGAMLLDVPGATPSRYAVTVSKDSHLYFLNSASLGMMGAGGETVDLTLSTANHSARTSPVSYTTATGVHVALTIDRGPYLGCPANSAPSPALAVLMGFNVASGSPATVTPSWCTSVGGPTMADVSTIKNRSGAPLVTTTDGMSQPIVWVAGSTSQTTANVPASILYGVDGESGKVLYMGGSCPGIREWTTPIAVKGHIVVGGDGHLCSWSPQ